MPPRNPIRGMGQKTSVQCVSWGDANCASDPYRQVAESLRNS